MLNDYLDGVKPVTRETIEELSLHNTLIYHVLNLEHLGHCTFEQALMRAVVLLDKQNSDLGDKLLNLTLLNSRPLIVKTEVQN